MTNPPAGALSKVPEVTLGFWLIKVLATTLGETGGDAVTMSMDLGYAVGSFIFLAIFADRSLGIGYFGGSSILFAGLIASLAVWRWSEGPINVNTVATPRSRYSIG